MDIMYKVYEKITKNVSDIPPESGGILGGYNNIINNVEFDNGVLQSHQISCCYVPNVELLNKCIEQWSRMQIEFYGMFHTHFNGVSTLSNGDVSYIENIMKAMPKSKEKLYFPIVVLPERRMESYVCIKRGGKTRILEDSIKVIR